MGGEVGPLNLPMTILFAAIFAMLGLMLLITVIFSGMKPYDQIARANVEKLVSAIDEACFLGRDVGIKDFYLPQTTPIGSRQSSFGPSLRIRNDGDPKYVTYYEMFPSGEAISWEVYHEFGYRVVAMIPDLSDVELEGFDMATFISLVKSNVFDFYWEVEESPTEVDVVIGNLVLTDRIDPTTGKLIEINEPGMGEWDDNKFRLNTNVFSGSVDMLNPKYMSCGDNTICLKTKDHVYKYELEYCGNIDYINVYKESLGPAGKKSDFYLASPCKINKIRVYLTDCRQDRWDFEVSITPGVVEWYGTRAVEYPIYEYTENGLKSLGVHRADMIPIWANPYPERSSYSVFGSNWNKEKKFDKLPEVSGGENNCIVVKIGNDKDFCYTLSTPRKKTDPIATFAAFTGLMSTDGLYSYPIPVFIDYREFEYMGKTVSLFITLPHTRPGFFDIRNWIEDILNLDVQWRWPL